MRKKIMGVMLLISVLLTGCGLGKDTSGVAGKTVEKTELYVLAAASLSESMAVIAKQYNDQNDSVRVVLSLGSSGSLQRQIEQGAPADLFLSASLRKMKELSDEGYLAVGYTNLLKNEMVLVVPKDNYAIDGFEALNREGNWLLAMGEPASVPAGYYADEILGYYNLKEKVQQRTVLAKDVKEVMAWVEAGEVDAGLVYWTDALVSDGVMVVTSAPMDSHEPIIYPCAVLAGSDLPEQAADFLDYLLSEEALAVFESYGFSAYTKD